MILALLLTWLILTGYDLRGRLAWNRKLLLPLLTIVMVAPELSSGQTAPSAGGQSGFTIEVSVALRPKRQPAPLVVWLIMECHMSRPETGMRCLVIPVAAGQDAVELKFSMVPAGVYAIRAYQDLNGNGCLDGGLFGPREPWALSLQNGQARFPPRYEDIAFKLEADRFVSLELSQ